LGWNTSKSNGFVFVFYLTVWFSGTKVKDVVNLSVNNQNSLYTQFVQSQDTKFLLAGMQYVASSADLKTSIQGLVEAASASVGSDMGSLYLLDESRGVLKPYILHNLPESYVAGCREVPLGTQCCGRAALHKVPWIVEDMWNDPLFVDCREAAKNSKMRAAFSVPVLDVSGRCRGSLASHFQNPYTPSHYDLERQSVFAKLIAFALLRQDSQVQSRSASAAD
jgi:GAF domain-containing protein